uniref:Phosphatase tensin-type domain-containing protein n=1 Tax=Amphiprion percula TaxID=161767 RepID=A0A3P8TG68_AMPPE
FKQRLSLTSLNFLLLFLSHPGSLPRSSQIITILCPSGCPEGIYLQNLQEIISMLQSKHGHNYMLINLSQKHGSLTRMNHKVLDTGWVDLLAPSLDQIFSVCTVMENWLQTHSKHVLVLHCRVNTADLDMHIDSTLFLKVISVIADVSLDHFATRRFYNDKLSALMTPSQKRQANKPMPIITSLCHVPWWIYFQ